MGAKMFKIAICDDSLKVCAELEYNLDAYLKCKGILHRIDVFYSAETLIKQLNHFEQYDLIYLDIALPDISGVEVGVFLREILHDERTLIVYISGNAEYAMELFQVRPIGFLVKPLNKEEVFKILQKAVELAYRKEEYFHYKVGQTLKKLPAREILFFASNLKKIAIHRMQGVEDFYGKLSELQNLPRGFVQVHKSYIINWEHVKSVKHDMMEMMDGQIIPTSRAYRNAVQEKIKEWDVDI